MLKFFKTYQSDVILAVTIVLISVISFNLGKISAYQNKKTGITINERGIADEPGTTNNNAAENQNTKNAATVVVASKNSAGKLYHFPWCSSASKIADKNKVIFADETAAIAAGYTLAGNCQR